MADSDEEIAVVGIGCNFPGGEGLQNFWKILLEGKNCAVQIPDDRFDPAFWYDSDNRKAGKTQTAKAALIDGLNEFDHKFFGITEAEADFMDPQQKLLLECTYRALENAGIPMEKASGTRTGVFIGLMNRDYETLLNNSPTTITHYNGTGTAMSIAANRISYAFNFTGPSLAIDSACSSSLVALHYAAHAVRQGDCEMAVCGGVSCILEPRVFVALSKAKMISPDGSSKPFSNKADGYGRGEGCGIVLLKPLKKALRDFDHVWGIISKTAVNQDGRTVTPITRPSMAQQEELLHRIYSAGFDPSHIQYIEAHGTGTPVGDPTEAGSISRAVAEARHPGEALCIGSVKGNVGHTESAAGMAGLIKVLLMMHHETIVPSLSYSEDSASIDAKSLNLKIPTRVEKWEKTGPAGRAAGINNFGFGGTNAHAIVREYRQMDSSRSCIQDADNTKLFVLSAASEKSIGMTIADTHQELATNNAVDLKSLAYTSACRRSHLKHKYRKAFLISSLSDLQEQLRLALTKSIVPIKSGLKSVFVFCGNGVIYRGMCEELLKEEPIFIEKMKEVANLFLNYKSTNILKELENDDYSKPDVAQPLLFAIQVAIFSLLKHWGIRPDAVLGHSVGEVAAAHCSGLLSLEDAVKVIHFRSMLQSKVTGGKMLVVSKIAVSEIVTLLPAYSGKVCLAAFNSPQSCTLSGEADAVDSLHHKLKTSFKNSLFLHILDVPAAYHSHMMDPILDQIQSSIGSLQENEMEAELFSTVTGEMCSQGDFSSGRYWARNIREPVAFEQALRSAANNKKNIVFLEIGPRRALQRNIMETLGNDISVFPSIQPDKDHETLFTAVSKLFEMGVNVNWERLYNGHEVPPRPIPRYQFDCVKKDVYFEAVRQGNETTSWTLHPVIRPTKQSSTEFTCNLSSDATKYMSEHKNNGVALVPGALYVELALASFIASMKSNMPLCSLQLCISFQNPFILSENSPQMKVQLEPSEKTAEFKIHSQSATYASGAIEWTNGSVAPEERNISLDFVFKRCQSLMTAEQAYTALSQAGFQYGSVFRQLGDVYYGEEFKEAISTFRVPDEMMRQLHDYYVHPVVLDHFLQMTAVVAGNRFASRPGFPSGIGCVTVSGPLQNEMVIYLRTARETSDGIEVCGCFTDKEGHVLVELRHVKITLLGGGSRVAKEFFFHNELHATSEDASLFHKPKSFVFADQLGVGELLQQYLHSSSTFVRFKEWGKLSSSKVREFFTELSVPDGNRNNFKEVLFMCGIQDLSHLKTEMVLDHLVDCCELFREIVLALKAAKYTSSMRIITYRSAEGTVDHISPGFVVSGMTRACAAEISGFSFQLIDLATMTSEDIRSLAHVVCSYPATKYPELTISQGQIHSSAITRTPIKTTESPERDVFYSGAEHVILQTADPYKMTSLSAIPCNEPGEQICEQNIEVQLNKICVHSSEYFPVSVSAQIYGQTMYWNKDTSQSHNLLALDFSGTVTAVGRDVGKLKVGDHVVSCYPITASSKVVIPETACYRTKKLPFLKEVPCVSFFVLAWEILHHVLPKVRQKNKLGIISLEPDSNLMQVLMFTANQSGWNAIVCTQFSGLLQNMNRCDAFVLLPPFDASLVAKACSVSTVRNIVLVHDNQMPPILLQNMFRSDSENVCVQIVQVANLFQKACLKKQKRSIYSWLKSMRLNYIPVLKNTIFQTMTSGSIERLSVQESKSYLSSDITSVVVLDGNTKDEVSNLPIQEKPKQPFQQKSVYIVTGGLSGLGFETVKFIAQRGGGCIAIFSRRSSSHLQHEISDLQNRYGVSIISIQCDVSVSEQVVKAVTAIGQMFPSCPIRGVFHSAVILHDGLLETLDKSHYEKVFKPKVSGAMNLHHATKHCKLDYFVCYSSITSFIGNATQTNYAAANSFLDMFCHYRRRLGLAAQSINWGALNLGLLLNKESLQRFLETKGMTVMQVAEIHEGLEQCLLQNNAQQVVCKFSFTNLRKHVLSQNTSLKMRLSALVDEELRNISLTEPSVQLSTSPSSPGEYVRTMISETCNVDLQELSDGTTLSALGVDSMVSMTLQNLMFQETGVNVPLVKLLDPNSTISTLVSILEEGEDRYWNERPTPERPVPTPRPRRKGHQEPHPVWVAPAGESDEEETPPPEGRRQTTQPPMESTDTASEGPDPQQPLMAERGSRGGFSEFQPELERAPMDFGSAQLPDPLLAQAWRAAAYIEGVPQGGTHTSKVLTCWGPTWDGRRHVPFCRITMDIVGPLPKSSRGHRYILVVVDYTTRYPEALPLRAATGKSIAKELFLLFSRVGIAEEVLTDQGSCFMSEVMREMCRTLATSHHKETDASETGLGAVLSQIQDTTEHPITYISRKLLKHEKNYSMVEKECLAIRWVVGKLKYYLLGREFILITDHAPLKWMYRCKDTNARVTRWFLELQSFKFKVEHRAGRLQGNVDALSRMDEDLYCDAPAEGLELRGRKCGGRIRDRYTMGVERPVRRRQEDQENGK
ncbi:phenolphthiocerol/phthiocerol polyketide synthase subunit C-like [Conger conger]|uniref:phenolphthiocerol/phthiocerol polyketide synthase subunit C-like n=1 Tax=Conger conger TaxID=82655 RepID=UPI002A5A73C3|nr:phenolphthiocerol/phthiocerol polyketide synthase subunit C-like [Conger conger]